MIGSHALRLPSVVPGDAQGQRMVREASPSWNDNLILRALAPRSSDGDPIRGERVQLLARQVLQLPGTHDGEVYFPLDCLLSAAITLHDGETVGVMTVGAEGMVGISDLLTGTGSQLAVTVLVPGAALRVDTRALRDSMTADPDLQQAVLQYLVRTVERAAQAVACSRFHTIEQRCARWLLESSEAVRTDTLPVTHEQLAMTLGVRRPGLSVCLSHLQALN